MTKKVPKRIATTIINSLRGGVVPRNGTGYIAVGREHEIKALLNDVEIIEDGGATFRFIVGRYGSGKSFLFQTIRSYVMDKDFVVVDADLSPERRLTGNKGQGLATYKELVKNMSTKTKPEGGALSLILERWINSIKTQVVQNNSFEVGSNDFNKAVEKEIYVVINEIQELVNGFDFANIISLYWKASRTGNDELKNNVLRWLRGEYRLKSDVRKELGVSAIITDDNWYDYIKLLSAFLVRAGYKGMLMLIDELVNIYKIPHTVARQSNYEKILTMYNDTLQGKASHLGIIMSGTPQCVEDTRRGVFSYDALKSRLESGKFSDATTQDLLSPIIKLEPLTHEELFILIEKLSIIHADLYSYSANITEDEMISFLKMEFERIGSGLNITPREVIRDFIEILNILYQNPEKTIEAIIKGNSIALSENTITDEEIHDEFVGFEL
ncbi:MAG: ATP-binding protein [Acutalibacteraceae bacterium]|nr:ATP-binding protein [Acutalibacteraceae bacterium]